MSGGDHINLKVKSQEGNEVFFKIKRNTRFKKLMNAYCEWQSVEMNSIAFLFDGRRLRADQTPDELEMEDGVEIDAVAAQQYVNALQAALHEEQRETLQTLLAAHQRLETLEAAQREQQRETLQTFQRLETLEAAQQEELEHIADMHFQLEELKARVRALEERLDQSKAREAELEAHVRALEERLKSSGGRH